jgi:glutaminyl-tRNA synthetase
MANPESRTQLEKINLEPKVIDNTLANAKVTEAILATIQEAGITECDKKIGNLIYAVATKATGSVESKRAFLARYVAQGKITTSQQLDLAFTYLKKNASASEINAEEFEKSCGVGVVVTDNDIQNFVNELINKDRDDILAKRYTTNFGDYLKKIREKLPFADGGATMKIFNSSIEALLGPKTEEDTKAKAKPAAPAKKKEEATKATEESKKEDIEEEDDLKREKLSKLVARDLAQTVNTPELLAKHHQETGGKIVTRFPPEPNGYLHIGHAKAMRFSFQTAAEYGGYTYLRFDDTNPEKETVEFIENIKENVKWLGYTPIAVTHSSDNFQKLYDFAVILIKKDKAYVDQQTPDEIHEFRRNKLPSPYRTRPIEESLKMFEGMKNGLYEEGQVSLRLKIDPTNENPTLRDPIAYRIKYCPHPHAGNKWCIYPMYDYTHCICDSLENVTHSLCSLEFEIRRDLYYWILEQLDLYRPFVYEFSRLNISNTIMSKRRLTELVTMKYVRGWDDPRLPTLNGLRRKGYTPEAINDFCDLVSVTRRGNENMIALNLLEHCIRKDLDVRAKRIFALLDPVKVVIENVDDKYSYTATAPHFPKDASLGGYQITLGKEFYVDRSDIRTEASKDFFGFAPGALVGLKYAYPVKVKQIITDDKGEVTELRVDLEQEGGKPKTFLNWLPVKESHSAIVNLYDVLFTSYNPSEDADWKSSMNPNSLITKTNAKVHKSILGAKVGDKFQFERIGFFSVDLDSAPEKGLYVFNKTVSLVDKSKQKALKA